MNKLQYIFLLSSLVSFLSCNKHIIVEELIQAEKLMTNNPDSALVLLESIPLPEKMSKADYAEYCLLLTEARDKTYLNHYPSKLVNKLRSI